MIKTYSFEIETEGFNNIIDITLQIKLLLDESPFSEGSILVFIPGATAGITTIEYEPGLLQDYPKFFEKIIPMSETYHHDETWHDGNGFSHIRASLQGASFIVPFLDKEMLLGTWQQIILIDFDNRPRNRKVIVQISGE